MVLRNILVQIAFFGALSSFLLASSVNNSCKTSFGFSYFPKKCFMNWTHHGSIPNRSTNLKFLSLTDSFSIILLNRLRPSSPYFISYITSEFLPSNLIILHFSFLGLSQVFPRRPFFGVADMSFDSCLIYISKILIEVSLFFRALSWLNLSSWRLHWVVFINFLSISSRGDGFICWALCGSPWVGFKPKFFHHFKFGWSFQPHL